MHHLDDVFPPSNEKVSLDFFKIRSWNLFHMAGYHTLAHKDAEGLCTYIIVETGFKMWNVIRPGNGYLDAKDFASLDKKTKPMIQFTHPGSSWKRAWEDADAQVALLQLEPGDML